MKLSTISFLLQDDEVFLSKKKKGFGAGYLNGYGGKVEKGEGIVDGAIRELKEEAGVVVLPQDIEKVAIIDFYEGDVQIFECHIFFAHTWNGEFIESEEMAFPAAYKKTGIPFDQMWKGDITWLPLVFSGKKIHGKAYYKAGMDGMDRFEYESLV